MFHVVLVEPEIPGNTGNIARLCVALQADLHLVGPLGFSLDDRYLRRAGLDYWRHLRLHLHDDLASLAERYAAGRWLYTSSHAERLYTDWRYQPGDLLVFGRETAGLPAELLVAHTESSARIPQWGPVRSLNLANAVAIVAYEGVRQLLAAGELPVPEPPVPEI